MLEASRPTNRARSSAGTCRRTDSDTEPRFRRGFVSRGLGPWLSVAIVSTTWFFHRLRVRYGRSTDRSLAGDRKPARTWRGCHSFPVVGGNGTTRASSRGSIGRMSG